MLCGALQDNPFADSTLYELNTTYVPPDLNETVDAVVPAVAPAPAAAPNAQPAAFPGRAPTLPAVAGPAVPAAGGTVPALPFTGACLAQKLYADHLPASCCCETPYPLMAAAACCFRVHPQQHASHWQHRAPRWVVCVPVVQCSCFNELQQQQCRVLHMPQAACAKSAQRSMWHTSRLLQAAASRVDLQLPAAPAVSADALYLCSRPARAAGPAAAANGGAGMRPASAPPANTSLPGDADDPAQYPFWNVRRYRPYFDVDTKVRQGCRQHFFYLTAEGVLVIQVSVGGGVATKVQQGYSGKAFLWGWFGSGGHGGVAGWWRRLARATAAAATTTAGSGSGSSRHPCPLHV